jgi:hypothetical protein
VRHNSEYETREHIYQVAARLARGLLRSARIKCTHRVGRRDADAFALTRRSKFVSNRRAGGQQFEHRQGLGDRLFAHRAAADIAIPFLAMDVLAVAGGGGEMH